MNTILLLMPKGFSDEEKKIIQQGLIEKGIELFGKFGLKKTNVEDLTKAVGIAKGSFYSFYDSKEELFLDIFLKVQADLREKITDIITSVSKDPLKSFKSFMKMHLEIRNENPIIQLISDKETRGNLIRKLSNNPRLNILLQEYEYIPMIIKEWQKKGLFIEGDPDMLSGVLKAIFTIGMDQETVAYIGGESFSSVMDYLIDIIANHMIEIPKKK